MMKATRKDKATVMSLFPAAFAGYNSVNDIVRQDGKRAEQMRWEFVFSFIPNLN